MSEEPSGANEQSVVVNQLIAEFMSRSDAGEALTPEEFMAAHPEQSAELKQHFANVNLLEGLKETGTIAIDETIVKPAEVDDDSAADVTANTLVRGTADSETSVTRDHQQQNTGSATNIEIPETFGRYAIQKVLGQGAMGAVYLAKDTQLDRDVALKIPKFGDGNGVDDEELLARFYREARASATIRSLNICPVHDVGEIDGQHYITMAYIEGRPLKDFTKSKKSHSEKQIITTIRKLALGLAEAHKIGVVHRDLKPANIMVDLKGEPVVMDFGLARRSASDDVQVTQSGAILGTPAYMAPEQVAGDQSAIDHRVDIYALGIIMYELITGEMPFKGNLMSILQQIALNNPKKPSEIRKEIDPRLEAICLKMMAGDQTKRYQSMNDVAADLQDVLKNPNRKQKKEQAKKTGPKPKSIPTSNEESNPALISVQQPKSYAAQLREKKKPAKTAKPSSKSKTKSSAKSGSNGPPKNLLIAGGLGGLVLLMGIVFLVRVGKYDVQITLDDPSITLSVDGEVLNINDGQDVYKLSAGEHKLKLEKGGLKTHVEEFTVTKDGKTALRAIVVNGKLDGLFNGENASASRSNISETTDPVGSPPLRKEAIAGAESALLFDTPEARVEVGEVPIELDKPFTIEIWATLNEVREKLGATQQGAVVLGIFQLKVEPPQVQGGQGKYAFVTGEPARSRFLFDNAPLNGWLNRRVHVAGQWDGKEMSLFLNGQRTNNTDQAYGLGALSPTDWIHERVRSQGHPKLSIGNISSPGRDFSETSAKQFDGFIDQVRVSSVARYSSDFKPIDLEDDDKTVALYRFNEGSGDILKDSSGNGYHGKIIGAKWLPSLAVSAAESERTITPANGPVDLVPFIDLEKDVSHGSFEKRAGRLLAKGVKLRTVQVPISVSGDYSFRTSFVQNLKQQHNMEFFFPVGNRAAIVQIKYGGFAKLDPVGVKHEYTPDTLVKAGKNDVRIVVRQPTPESGHIEVDLNGTRILDWSGPIESLEKNARFEVQSFAVYEDENPISMSLEMLSERAVFLRPDVTLPRSNKQTNMPAKEDDHSRWPLQTSRPEDIVWLQGLNATLTLRSGLDQDVELKPADSLPPGSLTIVGVQFDKEDGQKVTDETLNRLATLTDLESLVLDFHPNFAAATKDGLPQLSALKNLRYLKLSEIGPEETDPTFLAAFPALQTLNLAYGAKYAWESGVSGSSSIQELKLYHMIPEDLESLAQVPGLTSLILTGRGNSRERREVAAKQFSTLAPWCRINVYDPGAPSHKATILEPTAPLPDPAANDGNQSPPHAVAPFDEKQAKAHQEAWADYLGVPVEYESSIGMKFRLIPPGEFLMGRTVHGAAGRKDSHKVILTKPVYVGVTEVTQSQYEQVMGTNPSYFSATGKGKDLVTGIETGNYPVERLTWLQAAEFCTKLSQQEKFKPFYSVVSPGKIVGVLEGTGYRLPTEAEWEFACRAGSTTLFWCGDNEDELHQVDWFSENSEMHSHMVGELESNPFGLSDMHGNVTEWIQDSFDLAFFDKLTQDPAIDPYSPFSANSSRVRRGGCLRFYARQCSSSSTYTMPATSKSSDVGFRTVLTVNAVQQQLGKKAAATPKPELTGRHGLPADSPAPAVAPFDEKQAKAHQEAWAKHLGVPVVTTNSIGMQFAVIPPGTFSMGEGRDAVPVALTKPFRCGVHEVTQGQWKAVMGSEPWSKGAGV